MHRAILGLAVAAAAAGVAVAASTGSATQSGKTIFVFSKPKDYGPAKFVDVAPKSPTGNPDHITPGDVIFQTVTLHNKAGAVIGKEYDELTFATPSVNFKSIDLVRTVYAFADGWIYTVAMHGPHLNGADAVIGGTGAYAGARGTVSSAGANGDAIHLLP